MESKHKSKSGEYWKDHVMSWESSAYYRDNGKTPSFWDRMSTLFRGQGMYVRMEAALKLAAPFVKDKVVLDIGCASGRFAFELIEAGAKKVIGIDVSPEAIETANQRRAQSPFANRLEFKVTDLTLPDAEFPQADIITALGVIEYFRADELDSILSHIKAKYFLFDFPDAEGRRKDWWMWELRRVYLWLNRCPGVYLYDHDEFDAMCAKHGYKDIWYTRHATFYYATNLPRT